VHGCGEADVGVEHLPPLALLGSEVNGDQDGELAGRLSPWKLVLRTAARQFTIEVTVKLGPMSLASRTTVVARPPRYALRALGAPSETAVPWRHRNQDHGAGTERRPGPRPMARRAAAKDLERAVCRLRRRRGRSDSLAD
jgi:hypothetical protein